MKLMQVPFLRRKPSATESAKPLIDKGDAAALHAGVDAISKPAPTKPKQARGRVIKEVKHPEYDPRGRVKRGGRVVKAMPRQLQQMQREQEKLDDDSQPKVEELDD